jgi:hypothetical protein
MIAEVRSNNPRQNWIFEKENFVWLDESLHDAMRHFFVI